MGEKERLVTTDRFPWHGGIQKCDVIANVTRKECIVCEVQLHAQLLWWVTTECVGLLVSNMRLSIAVSVLLYYNINDQQDTFVLSAMSLATAKNI